MDTSFGTFFCSIYDHFIVLVEFWPTKMFNEWLRYNLYPGTGELLAAGHWASSFEFWRLWIRNYLDKLVEYLRND